MRERYVRHFLQNVIELSDGLGIYYVQDCFCDRSALFGVELKSFFDHRQSVEWLRGCMIHDRFSIYNLRSFLVQNAPRRYMVHRMSDHQVVDEVARNIIDYDYPVVIRPWHEPPWCASNTIDVICAIQNGAPLSVMSRSPELDQAAKMLKSEVQKHSQGAVQSFQENLLAVNDIDPNDVDTARSSWDIEQWKHDHQLRIASQRQAQIETLLPHSPEGWKDPDAPRKVMVNVITILAITCRQIVQHPIDSLIIDPIKEFVGMFKAPKVDPGRDRARHDVLGRYYQNKDIDPNDLDTADHPGRPMQWVDSYNKRHQKDRKSAKIQIPSPEDTEKILSMLITYLIARRYGKAVQRGGEGLAEEAATTAKRTGKANPGAKKMPEVENPKPIEKLENKVENEYSTQKEAGRPKTTPKSELGDNIKQHSSARLGKPTKSEIKKIRKKDGIDSDSEAAAHWYVDKQKSTKSITPGEKNIKRELGIDPKKKGEKMVDLLKRDNNDNIVPIEVKNGKEIHLVGKDNAALAKFENIAKHGNMKQVTHFEVLANKGSKLPPNFKVDKTGKLYELYSGSKPPEFNAVKIGGKDVFVKTADLGKMSQ